MRVGARCFWVALLGLFAFFASCSNGEDKPAVSDEDFTDDAPTLSDFEVVVPSEGLPQEIVIQNANNNLDVIQHDGRVFLAFRTAPNHFASDKTVIYVISSQDQRIWSYEASFHLGVDLREPRLLSWNGKLFLYFAVLGDNPLDFEPKGVMVSEYLSQSNWTEPEWLFENGAIVWRTKVIDDVPYMLAYIGGGSIYDLNPKPIEVLWLTTSDGRNWEPVIPNQPIVLLGGGSETDFEFLDDGSLVAISRNELGEVIDGELKAGSKVCKANPESLGAWYCVYDTKKYDSPLVFKHKGEIYLIGRRSVTVSGDFDLGLDDLPVIFQRLLYELIYWLQPKRCSLWKIDADALRVDFVLDLPSCGDTCFPATVKLSENEYSVYNYTSPLDDLHIGWLEGQTGPTVIYRIKLAMPH